MIIQITDSEREQAATIEQLRQEITAWSVTAENLEAELERLNADKTDLLALNWKQGDKLIQVTDERDALKADANKAVELLATLFDRFENGVQCYEDPEECTGFLGHAVNLDDNEFCSCAELLNRLAPVEKTIMNKSHNPIGYVSQTELERLQSGHNASLRSARFGPSSLDGDVAVYLADKIKAGAAPTSQKPVAEVLLVDGEKVIDASMAFFDSVELGTKLYLAAGAAPAISNMETTQAIKQAIEAMSPLRDLIILRQAIDALQKVLAAGAAPVQSWPKEVQPDGSINDVDPADMAAGAEPNKQVIEELEQLKAKLAALESNEQPDTVAWMGYRSGIRHFTSSLAIAESQSDIYTIELVPRNAAAGAAPMQQEPMSNKPSDRILSFQIKRAIQAEDALHAAQKEIERLKSKPELTDAQILELWEQTYVQRGTSGIEFARAVLALASGAAPVPRMTGAALASQEPVAEVLLVDGEKVIDASMAFFDSVELGTKLYLAAGAAPNVEWNKNIRDSVDKLLEQAGYAEDSSARHQLSMMNFDVAGAAPVQQVIEELEQLKAKLVDQTKAADHWMGEACKNHNDLVRANEKLEEFMAQKPVAWLYEVNGRIKLETKRLDNYYWMGEGDSWVKGKPLILAEGSAPVQSWPKEVQPDDSINSVDPADMTAGAAPAAKVPEEPRIDINDLSGMIAAVIKEQP